MSKQKRTVMKVMKHDIDCKSWQKWKLRQISQCSLKVSHIIIACCSCSLAVLQFPWKSWISVCSIFFCFEMWPFIQHRDNRHDHFGHACVSQWPCFVCMFIMMFIKCFCSCCAFYVWFISCLLCCCFLCQYLQENFW